MAKTSGLGMGLFVDGYDLSGDIGMIDGIAGPQETLDVTAIDKSAFERLGGKRSGQIDFTSYFNPTTARAHPVLATLPTTNRLITARIGTALGDPAVSLVGKQINYDPTREDSGALTFKVSAQSDGYGIEWGVLGTAGKRTDTGATNGTGVDLGTGTISFGLQAYLQVFSFTGTSCTVKLQSSSDNGVGDTWADITGAGFVAASTAPQAQRIATASNTAVERYVRVVTTGTFSECTFLVQVTRNDTAVTF